MTVGLAGATDTIEELKTRAQKNLQAYFKLTGLKQGQLYDTKVSLSASTWNRIFKTSDADKDETIAEWLYSLQRVFNKLRDIAGEQLKLWPKWDEVFGDDFPQPPVRGDRATFNRARINTEEISLAATPLIEALTRAYESKQSNGNLWKNSEILSRLCAVLELTENWKSAAHYLEKLAVINRRTHDFHFEADARLRQGQAFFHDGDIVNAEKSIDLGMEIIASNEDRSPPYRTQLRLFNYKADIISARGDNHGALRILIDQCLPLAQSTCSDAACASVNNRIGIMHVRVGMHNEALSSLQMALEARIDLNMLSEISITLYEMGFAYQLSAKNLQAIFVWELATKMQIRNDDLDVIARTQLACAKAYMALDTEKWPLRITASRTLFEDRRVLGKLEKLMRDFEFMDIDIPDRRSAVIIAKKRLSAACHYARDNIVTSKAVGLILEADQMLSDQIL